MRRIELCHLIDTEKDSGICPLNENDLCSSFLFGVSLQKEEVIDLGRKTKRQKGCKF